MWQIPTDFVTQVLTDGQKHQQFLATKNMTGSTPPFLPDMAPCEAVIFMTSPEFRSSH